MKHNCIFQDSISEKSVIGFANIFNVRLNIKIARFSSASAIWMFSYLLSRNLKTQIYIL